MIDMRNNAKISYMFDVHQKCSPKNILVFGLKKRENTLFYRGLRGLAQMGRRESITIANGITRGSMMSMARRRDSVSVASNCLIQSMGSFVNGAVARSFVVLAALVLLILSSLAAP